MQITGKLMVFKNEYNGKTFYNTSIGSKQQDGTYENMSLNLQLPRDTHLHNKSSINVHKGFLSFYTKHDGTKVPKLIVMEFTQVNNDYNTNQQIQNRQQNQNKQNQPKPPTDDFSDLPF